MTGLLVNLASNYFRMGSTPTSDNANVLSAYDLGC